MEYLWGVMSDETARSTALRGGIRSASLGCEGRRDPPAAAAAAAAGAHVRAHSRATAAGRLAAVPPLRKPAPESPLAHPSDLSSTAFLYLKMASAAKMSVRVTMPTTRLLSLITGSRWILYCRGKHGRRIWYCRMCCGQWIWYCRKVPRAVDLVLQQCEPVQARPSKQPRWRRPGRNAARREICAAPRAKKTCEALEPFRPPAAALPPARPPSSALSPSRCLP